MCDEVFLSLLVRLLSLAQKKKKKSLYLGKRRRAFVVGKGEEFGNLRM